MVITYNKLIVTCTQRKEEEMKKKGILRLLLTVSASFALASTSFLSNKPQNNIIQAVSDKSLAKLKFHHQEILTVDHNSPKFTKKSESTKHGPWQKFSNLDYLNRAHAANALLSKKLMPKAPRTGLTWDPTGWHNKQIAGGWLYNRCHLIGFQLSGQNNNPRNLITGTRELNDPDMLKYENQVTDYIRSSNHHYVRYRVTPIYKGNDLLASGVEMQAQSIGDNSVHFHVYIFNEQPSMVLNYKTGTSHVKHGKTTIAEKARTRDYYHPVVHKKRVIHEQKNRISTAHYAVIGNRRSKIYHVASGENYHMSSSNAVYFKSEAAARVAGYRKSLR